MRDEERTNELKAEMHVFNTKRRRFGNGLGVAMETRTDEADLWPAD